MHAPLPLTTTIPMANPFDIPRFLARLLNEFATTLQTECTDPIRTPEGVCTLVARWANARQAGLGNRSVLDMLAIVKTPPSSDPPTAPSLPQEELRLLRTSFDTAFASLAGQVKELTDKVNGSRPPPQAATAKKHPGQPPPKTPPPPPPHPP